MGQQVRGHLTNLDKPRIHPMYMTEGRDADGQVTQWRESYED